MKWRRYVGSKTIRLAAAVALCVGIAACASSGRRAVPPGTAEPDKFLFDRRTTGLNDKQWLTAREFFKQVTETYTQSPLRPDAKLGIGDTYLGERHRGSAGPRHQRIPGVPVLLSDQSAGRLRAVQARDVRTSSRCARPERDQKRNAFEAIRGVRDLRDALSEQHADAGGQDPPARIARSAERVGISRRPLLLPRSTGIKARNSVSKEVLKQDPAFTGRDDVYFYLGESLIKLGRQAEALPYFEKLIDEFQESVHLEIARKRVEGLKTQLQANKS